MSTLEWRFSRTMIEKGGNMNLDDLEKYLAGCLYEDKGLLERYIGEGVREFPDKEVSTSAKNGNFEVPCAPNGPTTNKGKKSWDSVNRVWVHNAITWRQNFMFFDVIRVEGLIDGRFSGTSCRWDTYMELDGGTSREIINKLVNGHVGGLWTFKKHSGSFFLAYLGLRP